MRLFFLTILSAVSYGLLGQSFIHIDQFGYPTGGTKVAVISNPVEGYNANMTYTPGASINLIKAHTDSIVASFTLQSWNSGATHDQSGDQGWWLDFSSFDTPGRYYLHDPSTDEKSARFEIRSAPYNAVLKTA